MPQIKPDNYIQVFEQSGDDYTGQLFSKRLKAETGLDLGDFKLLASNTDHDEVENNYFLGGYLLHNSAAEPNWSLLKKSQHGTPK